jgi:ABC-type multidrug transport system permease subunit
VLPAWLQPVSLLYPVTHAVQALRSVTSGTESPLASLLWLLGFTAVALPLTAWAFQRCVLVARRRGTLGMT